MCKQCTETANENITIIHASQSEQASEQKSRNKQHQRSHSLHTDETRSKDSTTTKSSRTFVDNDKKGLPSHDSYASSFSIDERVQDGQHVHTLKDSLKHAGSRLSSNQHVNEWRNSVTLHSAGLPQPHNTNRLPSATIPQTSYRKRTEQPPSARLPPMAAPIFSGTEAAYRDWRKASRAWRAVFKHIDDETMVMHQWLALQGEARTAIGNYIEKVSIDGHTTSWEHMFQILDQQYPVIDKANLVQHYQQIISKAEENPPESLRAFLRRFHSAAEEYEQFYGKLPG